MELKQLRYLIGVVEAGGVLAASRNLHVAQPALSHHIANLEEDLGVKLFVRSNRGMKLTEDGHVFVEHARVVLADAERARNSVQSILGTVRGEVALGLPTSVATIATVPLFQAVREQFPNVKLKLLESHSGFLSEWLISGRLDLAVLFLPGDTRGFEIEPMLEERLVLVTQGRGKTTATKEVTLKQAGQHSLVLPSKEHGLRRIIDDAFAKAGISFNLIAEVDSLPTIKKLVQSGAASTILSPGAVSHEVLHRTLAINTIRRPYIVRQVVCARPVTRPQTPASRAVAKLIVRQLNLLVKQSSWPARWVGVE